MFNTEYTISALNIVKKTASSACPCSSFSVILLYLLGERDIPRWQQASCGNFLYPC